MAWIVAQLIEPATRSDSKHYTLLENDMHHVHSLPPHHAASSPSERYSLGCCPPAGASASGIGASPASKCCWFDWCLRAGFFIMHGGSSHHITIHYVRNKQKRHNIRRHRIKKRLLCVIGDESRNKASSIGALPAPTDNPRLLCRKIGDADVQAASPAEKKTRLVNTCLLYVR